MLVLAQDWAVTRRSTSIRDNAHTETERPIESHEVRSMMADLDTIRQLSIGIHERRTANIP